MAPLTLFHSPQTRSSGMRVLLEELGAPYDLHVVNMKAGHHRRPDYLAVNPLGKVPAIRHGDALITEQVAITLYLGDLFPAAALAPAFDSPQRGPYLRWAVLYAACFEPAVVDHAFKRPPVAESMSPYGTYDSVLDAIEAQAKPGPWLLGDTFTAIDVLWGMALSWTIGFGVVPARPAFTALVDRLKARPSFQKVAAEDAALAAQHEAAAG